MAVQRPTAISNFAVTYRCNSRCKTCNIWKTEAPEEREMTLNEIHKIFADNRGFLRDVGSMQITGGESFMREDLDQIVKTIHCYLPGCRFWIPTNGSTPRTIEKKTVEILGALNGIGLGITVSLDGLKETHDEIRGVKGAYEKAIETLKRLSAIRETHQNLDLAIGMTVTPENTGQINSVYQIARSRGAEFSFRPTNISGSYYGNIGAPLTPPDQADLILPQIRAIGRDLIRRKGLKKSLTSLTYMQGALEHIREETPEG
ncbi:MAG: radical SAM protein [Candidatus Bathyarchaeota archaeon]|jgi:MoaA/NifB/PqqE/SkfB family radical SAM enzyme